MAAEIVATLLLSRSEQAALFQRMPDAVVEVRPVELGSGDLGEPGAALIVIALTMITLSALCAWLSMQGKNITVEVKGLGASFQLDITDTDTPKQIRDRIGTQDIKLAKHLDGDT
jgi:hypothetical protein